MTMSSPRFVSAEEETFPCKQQRQYRV